MAKLLGREDLLSSNHLKRELVDVPELDGEIYLRELSTPQLLAFNARVKQLKADGESEVTPEISLELMSLVVSYSACDEQGVLLFSEEDVKQLTNNRIGVLERLSNYALKISGMDIKLSDAADNLKKAQSDFSSSNSATSSRRRKKKLSRSLPVNT